jgi:hypothetical protein
MNDEQAEELAKMATDMEQAIVLIEKINVALKRTMDYRDLDEHLMSRLVNAQNDLQNTIERYSRIHEERGDTYFGVCPKCGVADEQLNVCVRLTPSGGGAEFLVNWASDG